MSENKQRPLFGVGGMTLLTVLLVLALTMFAVLTLSSAQADMRLSQKSARAVSDYYAADSVAARLQSQAAAMWPLGPRPKAALVRDTLAADYDVGVSEVDEGLMFFCDIPIAAGGQILQVTMYLAPPGPAQRWRIDQWQFLPPPMEVEEEQPLPVWQGE